MFRVNATIMERIDGTWSYRDLIVDSKEKIRSFFGEDEIELGDALLNNVFVFYNPRLISKDGITAKMTDSKGEMHYMCSPLMFLALDDKRQPANLSPELFEATKVAIDFY